MPICKKCGESFPTWLEIDGKRRNLHRRKYCLVCSPFGKHNQRQRTLEGSPCTCRLCGRDFTYGRAKGHRRTICNSCSVQETRRKQRVKSLAYKGGKCLLCGYEKYHGALEFHHLNPTQKDPNFMSGTGASYRRWEGLRGELDKCVLLCANCHREVHGGLIDIPE